MATTHAPTSDPPLGVTQSWVALAFRCLVTLVRLSKTNCPIICTVLILVKSLDLVQRQACQSSQRGFVVPVTRFRAVPSIRQASPGELRRSIPPMQAPSGAATQLMTGIHPHPHTMAKDVS